jgi:hypothetical protein
MVTRGPGSPAFGAAQARALTLLRGQDNPDNLVPVIYNAALHAWACGRLADADATTDEIFDILEAEPSDGAFLAAHTMRGLVAWHRGDNAAAFAQLSATVDRYDPELHREFYMRFLKEFGVFGRFYLGLTHTVMGERKRAGALPGPPSKSRSWSSVRMPMGSVCSRISLPRYCGAMCQLLRATARKVLNLPDVRVFPKWPPCRSSARDG